MKKLLAVVLALTLAFALVACGGAKGPDTTKGEGVMTYAEYAAAALDTEVTIEAYVQAKQGWWDNKATIYTQNEEGAYFIYNAACSEADYAKLEKGTKIKVKGYKAEWSGEVEIAEGVIIAKRHIHMTPADAEAFGVADKEIVKVKLDTPRALIFDDVVVRVSPKFAAAMHIDTDESNAAAPTGKGIIIK